MVTHFLTREEMHGRVDNLYDALEDAYGEEVVGVIGDPTGSTRHFAPTERKDFFRLTSQIGYAPYAFDRLAPGLERFREPGGRGLYGTLLVPVSDLSGPVNRALEGDEDAIAALEAGEVPADA